MNGLAMLIHQILLKSRLDDFTRAGHVSKAFSKRNYTALGVPVN
jgi:hypothetical protein